MPTNVLIAGGGPAALEVALGPDGDRLEVDRLVTLPRLDGPNIPGLPADPEGLDEEAGRDLGLPVNVDVGAHGTGGIEVLGLR